MVLKRVLKRREVCVRCIRSYLNSAELNRVNVCLHMLVYLVILLVIFSMIASTEFLTTSRRTSQNLPGTDIWSKASPHPIGTAHKHKAEKNQMQHTYTFPDMQIIRYCLAVLYLIV